MNDTNTISANPNNKNIVTSETQNDLKIPGYNFSSGGGSGGFVSVSGRQRKSSISINDINWNELNLISEIPKFESLNIDDNLKNSLINSTLDKLNQFELDNLYHNLTTTTTQQQYLSPPPPKVMAATTTTTTAIVVVMIVVVLLVVVMPIVNGLMKN